jgi:hypothetical protein
MAKIRVVGIAATRTKIQEWKAGNGQADEIIYDPDVLEAKDIQLWAFNQGVLVDIQEEVGPFKKIVFSANMV